ncbi:probable mediator of RNA polymerase II transcription subunit 26c isoform X1 [Solanum dulcamara]|uniref:probable mediator of RNA polymerase II transcription subunit 26c isoform X1 n=1 Tax=Solanum dulcamara TaxID=45834 RepID=UPI002485F179|nr:probable mediator of RNA polymerase II transcription subunit 26c isoform X1 [Solanum dulcamara]
MELDELRLILKNSGVDLWGLIDTAISVAILDHGNELRSRRDAIVERLYTPLLCNNSYSAEIPKSIERNIDDDHKLKTEEKSTVDYEEDLEISKIITIKNHFEISNQSENCLVDLLQCLAEMDISFKVLEKTDIGRHVNRLRKHSSNEVRRLVKLLIRRWKDIVDEWVRLNTSMEETDDFEDGAYISNDSPLYCGHKHSVEKDNNSNLSTKRLREDYMEEHYAKAERRREVELEDVGN